MVKISTHCFICETVAEASADPKFISGGPIHHRAKNLFILLQRALDLPDPELRSDQSDIVHQISFCKSCLDELEVTKDMLDAFEKLKKMAERHKKEIQSKFLEGSGRGPGHESHGKSNKQPELEGLAELRSQMVAGVKSKSAKPDHLAGPSTSTKSKSDKVSPSSSSMLSGGIRIGDFTGGVPTIANESSILNENDLDSESESEQKPPVPVPGSSKAGQSGIKKRKISSERERGDNLNQHQQQTTIPEKKIKPPNKPSQPPTRQLQLQLCLPSSGIKTKHLKIQTSGAGAGGKPFSCKICAKTFAQKSSLTRHHQVFHSGRRNKPFSCKFCSKAFAQFTNLKVHEGFHFGQKTHWCRVCLKAFSTPGDLVRHMRAHARKIPSNQCSIRNSEFAQRQSQN